MPESFLSQITDAGTPRKWVRLRTLLTLRWIAISGQIAAVVIAAFVLGVALPLEGCFALITASIVFNIVVGQINPPARRLDEHDTAVSLMYDQVQLAALLMLTGGLANPFALLMLGPVMISASVLSLRATLVLGATTVTAITVIMMFHIPLRLSDGSEMTPPGIYLIGAWAGIVIATAFIGIYMRLIAVETSRMRSALLSAQMALAREQRLTAIGGLAAAAAHELGTPLATIKLVSGEMRRDVGDNPELREDVELIHSQAERCRTILADLSQGGRDDTHVRHAPVMAVVEEAAEPHRNRGRRLILRLDGDVSEDWEDQPDIPRKPEIVHGLRNFVQNAVDFSTTAVWIDVETRDDELRISVGDDGPGFRDDVLERLGDPYVTTARRRAPESLEAEGRREYAGMGLGLFIAKTLLERTGARIDFANGSDAPTRMAARIQGPLEVVRPSGAIAVATWRLQDIVAARAKIRGPLGFNPRFSDDAV